MSKGILDPERGFLNKWEMYKALHGKDIGPCRLPVTAPYSHSGLVRMLRQFDRLYVKPVDSWGGRGITVVERTTSGYRTRNLDSASVVYGTIAELAHHVAGQYRGTACIVQQGAPLISPSSRPFDIRLLMQRDIDEAWVPAGTLVRVGGENSIVSNVAASGGHVAPLESFLQDVLKMQDKQIPDIIHRIEQVGHKVCDVLAEYRWFHEVGLDIGLGRRGTLWLIEVNTDDAIGGPSHELFAQLPDKAVYQAIQERMQANRDQLLDLIFGELMKDNPEEY